MFSMRRAAMRLLTSLAMAAVMILTCGCEEGQYIELPLEMLQQLTPNDTAVSQSTQLQPGDAAALANGEAQPTATPTEAPTATETPGVQPTAAQTPAATATPTPTSTPVPTTTPAPTATPAATAAPTGTPAPSATPEATATPEAKTDAEKALETENVNHEATLKRLNDAYQAKRGELEYQRSILMIEPDYSNSEFAAELEQNTIALDLARMEHETAVAEENARHESELARLGA